jgi:hypothetical protein
MASTCFAVAFALFFVVVGAEVLWDALTMPRREDRFL